MVKLFLSIYSFFICLVTSTSVFGQSKETDSLTIEKALSVYRLSTPVFSSDGKKAAFAVTKPATADKPSSTHIWLLDLKDSSTRQYTNSNKSESNPKWEPKGKALAFLSGRDGERQVYTLNSDGGEAIKLT
ncbi:MAG: hypothetical protein ABUT20_31410, partial [Bacteroidota bacterium]